MLTPFYDPSKSYEENFTDGPFGIFETSYEVKTDGEPKYDFFGLKVYSPFGIPAGPLINSNFCKAAFLKGYDICVYKTVRSGIFPCHPFPNVLSVKVDGDLTLEKASQKLVADNNYTEPLSITNSFGVPSKDHLVWQEDVKKAMASAREGQVLVLSFMGTVKENQTAQEFIEDWRLAAKYAKETGAKVFEANLSCPNIGNEGLVCYDLEMTRNVCKAIREELGDSSLILKVGYYKDEEALRKLAEIANEYAQGISSINTIAAEIVDKNGNQALPGKNRARSGICGHAIKWAGIDMVEKLKKIRIALGYSYIIIGVGGVMSVDDFKEYEKHGADIVMSATGAMWNPYLARDIKHEVLKQKITF
jgi:dihydroorotate dehydrogenase (NAD+) catalytic subunit